MECAAVPGGYAYVCALCGLWRGLPADRQRSNVHQLSLQALLEAMRHIQQEHLHQQVVIICLHRPLVESVLQDKPHQLQEHGVSPEQVRYATSLYRSLPYCRLQSTDVNHNAERAKQWALLVAKL